MLFIRERDAIWTNLNGKTVVMGIGSGKYFEIEGVGQKIWDLLEQERSIQDLVSAIVTSYAVDADQCGHDVQNFIDALQSAELIRVVA